MQFYLDALGNKIHLVNYPVGVSFAGSMFFMGSFLGSAPKFLSFSFVVWFAGSFNESAEY